MTDKQIVNALEYCCGNITFDSDCSAHGCYQVSLPEDRNGDIRWCRQWLMKDTLELIERQKAEIEKMRKKNKILIKDADTAFQDGLNENRDLFKKEVEPEIRAEAIKEFAERLKEEMQLDDDCNYDCINCHYECKEYLPLIDNLVKEMTEADK